MKRGFEKIAVRTVMEMRGSEHSGNTNGVDY